MYCISRLLAVIGCSFTISGCNLNQSDAEENAGPESTISALTPNEIDEVVSFVPRLTRPDEASVESASTDESAAVGEGGENAIAPVAVGEPPAESEEESGSVQSPAETIDVLEGDEDLETSEADSRYTYSDDHDPNGIGKFYMGREIAQVMGHQGIAWLERPEREEEEGLSLLIECLDIEPGSTVADIGAGSGVLTVRFCEAVGEEGTVVAVDIQQEMLDALQLKCHELGFRNVELVLGTPMSPQLPEESVDLVVMVDVYHEFDHPYEMLLDISRAVRPGGRVVFVEYRKEDPTVLIKLVHKMTEEQVLLEASLPEFHLEHVETLEDLPVQHVIVFRKLDPDAADGDPASDDEGAPPQ